MDNADPAKKSRSKTIQSELSTCRDRVRLLVEDKVGKLIFQNFLFFLTVTFRTHLTPPSLSTQKNSLLMPL